MFRKEGIDYEKEIIDIEYIHFSFDITISAFAGKPGSWRQAADGRWWFQCTDGTYPSNGWSMIDDIYYYFDSDGWMLANTITPDGYYVDASGAWVNTKGITGDPTRSSKYRFLNFDQDHYSQEGGVWSRTKGWTYTKPDGSEAIGWTLIDGDYHYFDENGWMHLDCLTPDGYVVDENGVWNQGAGRMTEDEFYIWRYSGQD